MDVYEIVPYPGGMLPFSEAVLERLRCVWDP